MAVSFFLAVLAFTVYGAPIPNCNGPKPGDDAIKSLSGYNPGGSNPHIEQYSGFVQVNATANGSLFYWLVSSIYTKSGPNTPLLIWLNGGPGASSLTGMLAENGPFRIKPGSNAKELTFNNWTWARHFNMLFVDNPINTGFSFCNGGDEVTNEDQMGQNFLKFMQGFYECHPELANNPLYITGESYAGRYIPYIYKHISATYNVKGLAIGNGIYDPFIQFHASPFYAYVNGIIDHETYEYVDNVVTECLANASKAANEKPMNIQMLNDSANVCLNVTNAVYGKYGGNIFQYDIRENDADAFDSLTNDIATYLGQRTVANDLHTFDIPWKSSDGTSAPNPVANALNYDIVLNNSASIIPEALASGTRILFYNGQFDGSVCNNFGNQECLAQLNYQGNWTSLPRAPIFINNLSVGYWKESHDHTLAYFVVADSGHLVPYNEPETIYEVISGWINQK